MQCARVLLVVSRASISSVDSVAGRYAGVVRGSRPANDMHAVHSICVVRRSSMRRASYVSLLSCMIHLREHGMHVDVDVDVHVHPLPMLHSSRTIVPRPSSSRILVSIAGKITLCVQRMSATIHCFHHRMGWEKEQKDNNSQHDKVSRTSIDGVPSCVLFAHRTSRHVSHRCFDTSRDACCVMSLSQLLLPSPGSRSLHPPSRLRCMPKGCMRSDHPSSCGCMHHV